MREKPLVLLVDDEDEFLEIASAKLQEKGFETVIAHNASDAEAKAESLAPDLVLSDIYMPPGPSGWDLAFALRSNPKTKDIKFAFFTSLRDPWAEVTGDRKKMAEDLGKVAFLSKMDDVCSLGESVANVLKE